MESLFWWSFITLVYIYFGYPLLLKVLPKKPISELQPQELPTITVLIPAFNEEDVIEATVRNKFSQDYPEDKLKVIVISDESEDQTDNIIEALQGEYDNLSLIRQIPRQGKTSGLNLAMESVDSDIIVFADANSIYNEDVLQHFARTFSDLSVGYITGKMVYVNSDGSLIGDGCSAYMKYENGMRSLESDIGSVVGVDGGVDAMRTQLHSKLNADQLPDFVQPLKVVEQGYRVTYQDKAILKEEALSDNSSEYRMRVRVSLRALWALWDMKTLFNPLKFGLFSLQLFSHKLLRYIAFLPMLLVFISNIALLNSGVIYSLSFAGQVVFYFAAYLGFKHDNIDNKYVGLAHYFCLINYAAFIATIKFFKGEKIVVWKPRQG